MTRPQLRSIKCASVARLPASLRMARAIALSVGARTHHGRTLTTDARANPKVAKSADAVGTLTLPLHLAPANSGGAGVNVCPFAGACIDLCLDGAGNPVYQDGKTRARKARTVLYANARDSFMTLLLAEIAAHVAASRAARMDCAVRLNATSDILYERIPVTVPDDLAAWIARRYDVHVASGAHPNIMHAFPSVTFYDYTKVPPKHRAARLPANYSLTYSYDPANDARDLADAVSRGWNVAVPVQVRKGQPLPDAFAIDGVQLPAIDGDLHDFRPADPRGVFVLLRFKRITARDKVRALGAAAARGDGFALPLPDADPVRAVAANVRRGELHAAA